MRNSQFLATLYYRMGNYQKAKNLYLKSIEKAKELNAKEHIKDGYLNLSLMMEEKNDYKDALKNYKLFHNWSDSILNDKKNEAIASLLTEYKTKEIQDSLYISKQNEELANTKALESEKEAKISKLESEKKKRQLIIALFGIVLLAGLFFLLFQFYRQKKRANIALEQKNFEISKQKAIIEEKHAEITDSINYAKRIQTALLTSDEYWYEISKEHFVLFKPKDVVSGDFFWAYQTPEDLAIWIAADCTGHGVPGAFMSMLGIGFLNEIIVENKILKPNLILNELRKKVISSLEQKNVNTQQKDGMDMALCAWDKKNGMVNFSGANNPLWVIRKGNEDYTDLGEPNITENGYSLYEIKADKMPVGSYTDELKSFNSISFKSIEGDTLYTFSDGYSDQFGGDKGKKFKSKELKKLLLKIQEDKLTEQKSILDENLENWRNTFEQVDDICIIGVRLY